MLHIRLQDRAVNSALYLPDPPPLDAFPFPSVFQMEPSECLVTCGVLPEPPENHELRPESLLLWRISCFVTLGLSPRM